MKAPPVPRDLPDHQPSEPSFRVLHPFFVFLAAMLNVVVVILVWPVFLGGRIGARRWSSTDSK